MNSTASISSFTDLTNLSDGQFDDEDENAERCEIVIVNPCFGLRYYPTDLVSLSSFGCVDDDDDENNNNNNNNNDVTVYDYDSSRPTAAIEMSLRRQLKSNGESKLVNIDPINLQYKKLKSLQQMKSELKTTSNFPLHEKCAKGSLKEVQFLLHEKKYDPLQPDQDKWYPIHHAAWNGHEDCVQLLLKDYACSPNLRDNFQMTALHYAALQGHVTVVKLLLEHPDVDMICKNHEGKTALNMCEHNPKSDWLACSELIRNRLDAPFAQINVRLMDGSIWNLDLVSGSNTTAQQLSAQMLEKLELPKEYQSVFTVWICSKNLQLQLKGDHKPVEHLADWRRCIIPQFTDVDPTKEEPSLLFKRDARLVLNDEKKVLRQPWAIRLLCFEAYHNYINSMYPCSENDVVRLAAIFMEITNGDFDIKKWKAYLAADEKNLQLFIPADKLRRKNASYWAKLILKEYESKYAASGENQNEIKLQYKFLVYCWNLTVYGSAFFHASFPTNKNKFQPIYVCVNDVGVHLVNKQSRTLEMSFAYSDIYWTINTQVSILEIRIRGAKHGSAAIGIYTKQCILINHLMAKLESITTHQ